MDLTISGDKAIGFASGEGGGCPKSVLTISGVMGSALAFAAGAEELDEAPGGGGGPDGPAGRGATIGDAFALDFDLATGATAAVPGGGAGGAGGGGGPPGVVSVVCGSSSPKEKFNVLLTPSMKRLPSPGAPGAPGGGGGPRDEFPVIVRAVSSSPVLYGVMNSSDGICQAGWRLATSFMLARRSSSNIGFSNPFCN